MSTTTIEIGTRVYYKDKGPNDTGTIIDIIFSDYPFVVKWDHSKNSDETVDCFKASQLVLLNDSL